MRIASDTTPEEGRPVGGVWAAQRRSAYRRGLLRPTGMRSFHHPATTPRRTPHMTAPDTTLRPYARPANARLVSYSELSTMDCWLKHHYAYTMGLKPITTWVGMRLGRAWDTFQNTWHAPVADGELPLTPDARLAAGLTAAGDAIEQEAREVDAALLDKGLPLPIDWREQLDHIRTTITGMAHHYAARYATTDEDWRTLAVQLRFEVPFPSASSTRRSNRYWLHGVIDRVAEHLPSGRVFIIDAKLRDGAVDQNYRDGFATDLQLPLYAWALKQLPVPYADRVAGGIIDAASTALPSFPKMKSQPEVILGEDGEPLVEALPCPACEGDDWTFVNGAEAIPCPKCNGEQVARYASGERKGEVKTRKVTRPALYADAETTTTLPAYLAALQLHGLPIEQYAHEVQRLTDEWTGAIDNKFHWRTDELQSMLTDAELNRAIGTMVGVAPFLDTLPPVPMPARMKCKWCSFKAICPSTDPAAVMDTFTTRSQRTVAEPDRRVPAAAPF